MVPLCVSGILSCRIHVEHVVQRLRTIDLGREEISVVFGPSASHGRDVWSAAARDVIAAGVIGWLAGPEVVSVEDCGLLIASGIILSELGGKLSSVLWPRGFSVRQTNTIGRALLRGEALLLVEVDSTDRTKAVLDVLEEFEVDRLSPEATDSASRLRPHPSRSAGKLFGISRLSPNLNPAWAP